MSGVDHLLNKTWRGKAELDAAELRKQAEAKVEADKREAAALAEANAVRARDEAAVKAKADRALSFVEPKRDSAPVKPQRSVTVAPVVTPPAAPAQVAKPKAAQAKASQPLQTFGAKSLAFAESVVQASRDAVEKGYVAVSAFVSQFAKWDGGRYFKLPVVSDKTLTEVWVTRVIPKVKAEAAKRGVDPYRVIAQLMKESTHGRGLGRFPDGPLSGHPNWNYGGIKVASITYEKFANYTLNWTREDVNGKSVRMRQKFAAFPDPEAFVEQYFKYMFRDTPLGAYTRAALLSPTLQGWMLNMRLAKYATDKNYEANMTKLYDMAKRQFG